MSNDTMARGGRAPSIRRALAAPIQSAELSQETPPMPLSAGTGVVARPDADRSAPSSGVRSAIDRERLWPAKLRHPIQDVAREARLDLSAVVTAGSQAVPDDPLVPEEHVLDARLPMIARRLLPSSAAECLHPPNGPIPGARPRSPARDTGRPVGWDNDGCAPPAGSRIERDRIVRGVSGHSGDVLVDSADQRGPGRRIVDRGIGQRAGDDHARRVDAEMQLPPPALAAPAMSHRGPFTFADDRKAGAVHAQVDRAPGWNTVEFDAELLSASGQGGVVRSIEVGLQQGKDRPHEALRLA